MRLTTFTDYSLRVLIYLGVQDDELATISEIAEAYGISKNHLMKVVHFLGQHGYVETLRGKAGGVRLARPPEAINLGELVRTTEINTALVECLSPDPSDCCIESACALRGILQRSLQAFYSVLDEHTLMDVLRNRNGLQTLLRS